MKNILLYFILNFFFFQFSFAQNEGKISYSKTIKLDIKIDGISEEMLSMIPKSQSVQKELMFNKSESVFQSLKGEFPEDLDMSSDDGSYQIKFQMGDEVEDILYMNLKDKIKVHQKGIMGKAFVVKEDFEKFKWKITNEKIKYLDFECQKAVMEDEDGITVAWFTSQIPLQIGPSGYYGLPGAILMVSVGDGEVEYKATSVEFLSMDDNKIKEPTKGKKVSADEYDKIQKEKTEEMKKMYSKSTFKTIGH